jgi:LysR family nitrogen assimilation transcriptional regulator
MLAGAGHGVAVVPSTVRFASAKLQVLPIVRRNRSLGTWGGIVWDPRRSVPRYAAGFIEELEAYVSRAFPVKRFGQVALPLAPRPPRGSPEPPAEAF